MDDYRERDGENYRRIVALPCSVFRANGPMTFKDERPAGHYGHNYDMDIEQEALSYDCSTDLVRSSQPLGYGLRLGYGLGLGYSLRLGCGLRLAYGLRLALD